MARTLTIIKPDAVAAGNTGNILAHLQAKGFAFNGLKMVHLSQSQARAFYSIHSERPFYDSLVEFMTGGPVVVVSLEAENAVPVLRAAMGATDVSQAEEGTIRNLYGTSIEENAIHGSDSDENARIETSFFFCESELL